MFALAGANKELAVQLGQNVKPPPLRVDSLPSQGLPNPMLALKQSLRARLEQNADLVHQFFPALPGESLRRLMLGLDHTYLLRGLVQVQLNEKAGMVGACWRPSHDGADGDRTFMAMDRLPEDALATPKAPLMLECLTWDPAADRGRCLSLASMPMSLKPTETAAAFRNQGKWVSGSEMAMSLMIFE